MLRVRIAESISVARAATCRGRIVDRSIEMPSERLWASVYLDDDEASDIWQKEIGVPAERIMNTRDRAGLLAWAEEHPAT